MICWLFGHDWMKVRVHGPDSSDPIHRYATMCYRCGATP